VPRERLAPLASFGSALGYQVASLGGESMEATKHAGWRLGTYTRGMAGIAAREQRLKDERRLWHICEVVKTLRPAETAGTPVVVYLRTSGRSPEQLKSHKFSRLIVADRLAAKGYRAAIYVDDYVSGRSVNRRQLKKAIAEARRRGCPLVIESLSRLVRHPSTRKRDQGLPPTVEQIAELKTMLDGVPVYSIAGPTWDYSIIAADRERFRRHYSQQQRSKSKPGPRREHRSPEEWRELVIACRERDCSLVEFEQRYRVTRKSIRTWAKKLGC
jgi:hypothetical protein